MAHIRTMTRHGKRYYYLEHTVRDGTIVRMERKYLGDSLPGDSTALKEEFEIELFEKRYKQLLIGIRNKTREEFDALPETAKIKYLESFLVKFTYDSNRIEGSTLSLKDTYDILAEGRSPSNKPLSDIKEAEGHKKAFYEMLSFKDKLTLGEVLYWHTLLFRESKPEIAGKIRNHGVAIARSKARLALPAEIEPLLREFFTWYEASRANPAIKAALVHLKFVTIHPFTDGNGRISRLLMNHVLHSNGYPMLNITYLNRKAYYNALERSQLHNNVTPFLNFLIKRFIKEHGGSRGL